MGRVERRPRASRLAARLAAILLVAGAPAAHADDAALLEKVEKLESRVRELEAIRTSGDGERAELESRLQELEASRTQQSGGAADWTRRIRLSGSANAGYYDGGARSLFSEGPFQLWDARLFLDADLGRDVHLGEVKLLRDVGFAFEWNVVRLGALQHGFGNTVGEAYVDLQGIADQGWLNVQLGRFQIPVGEAYLRYSRGYSSNPLITNPVGGPWWWDEGLRFYGSFVDGFLGYVASLTNGDTDFNGESDAAKQMSLKLWTEPAPWLHLSASALRSGGLGSPAVRANGALWLGETWATPVGSMSGLPTFTRGVAVPDGPNRIHDTIFFGGDAIVHVEDAFRFWLSYGYYDIRADGAAIYDRELQEWIAELIVEGALAARVLRPFYAAARASGLGTYDSDRGYLSDFREGGTIGYNARSLETYSFGLGWRITDWVTMRAEYQIREVDLVRGVPSWLHDAAQADDMFGVELGARF
jgi:hypothetical protein